MKRGMSLPKRSFFIENFNVLTPREMCDKLEITYSTYQYYARTLRCKRTLEGESMIEDGIKEHERQRIVADLIRSHAYIPDISNPCVLYYDTITDRSAKEDVYAKDYGLVFKNKDNENNRT